TEYGQGCSDWVRAGGPGGQRRPSGPFPAKRPPIAFQGRFSHCWWVPPATIVGRPSSLSGPRNVSRMNPYFAWSRTFLLWPRWPTPTMDGGCCMPPTWPNTTAVAHADSAHSEHLERPEGPWKPSPTPDSPAVAHGPA